MSAPGLVFYPKSHRYKLDGAWVPGVTTIISGGLPKDALKFWAAKSVAEFVAGHPDLTEEMKRMGGYGPTVAFLKEVPFQQRDDAAVRGTDVHDIAEKLAHGEEVDVPEHLSGYVSACVDFLDDWGLVPLVTEKACASRKWQHAGKFDFIGTVKDGRTLIGDWKTTSSGIWPETCLQLAAYRHSEFYADEDGTEHPMPEVDGAIGVHLRDDGYSVYNMRADESVYRSFLHVAWVSRMAKEMKRKDDWVTPVATPSATTDVQGETA